MGLALGIATALGCSQGPSATPTTTDPDLAYHVATVNLLGAAKRGDYRAVLASFDDSTAGRLEREVEGWFGGNDEELMRVFWAADHPARYRLGLRMEAGPQRDGCTWRKIVVTGPYTYMDGEPEEQRIGPKPVELWTCFVDTPQGVRIRLDFPVNDILYLLQ